MCNNIFKKIITREIPAYIVGENDTFLAFLDIHPLKAGHTLVIPKKEIDYLFDIEDDLLEDMILFSKKIARKIKSVIPCKRIAMAVVGLDVPHAHIHLIPINSIADFDFNKQTEIIKKDEMKKICELIFNA